ncbi:MAG: glucose-1-phosphate cytidylyltransferase [Candidatus Omnitrophica bacterium]|nr:glucose-1-phosphate cytidylyltransferase [Candidatus Omnitrophota bacterium]
MKKPFNNHLPQSNLKVVILCGGAGTRLREETDFRPKPLVEVGGRPILWHVMKIFSHYGLNDFVLCLGHKGHMIKEYFLHYMIRNNDFTIQLDAPGKIQFHGSHDESHWKITLVDTGLHTMTGGRVLAARPYIDTNPFLLTYGDGVGNVNIHALLDFHRKQKTIATLTGVRPQSQFGIIEVAAEGKAVGFKEKPRLDSWVNGGFFVLQEEIFNYLKQDSILEQEPLKRLAAAEQLSIYPHNDFWQCMDTFKDVECLNQLWNEKKAEWKLWE